MTEWFARSVLHATSVEASLQDISWRMRVRPILRPVRHWESKPVADLIDFVGTWRAEGGSPFSTHTFTWESEDARLHGLWLVEAPDSPAARAAAAAGKPLRIEMQISDAWLEDGLLLFRVNGVPFVSEFRLVGEGVAVVGAAVHTLSGQFAYADHKRSIEGHRVRLTRQSTD
jgi:hypothetical protein